VIRLVTLAAALFALLVIGEGCRALAPAVRYPAAIAWQPYEAGLARAKAEGKPVMLIFGADWCEPCHELSDHVLSDPRVVAASRDFVMVHVDVDEREDLAAKYPPDGYTPRIVFLTADGLRIQGAHTAVLACRKQYTYDSKDPASLLTGMALARKLAAEGDPTADPLAVPEYVCMSTPGANACAACIKQRCCAERIACFKDPACWCMGSKPPRGPATAAITACLKDHCPECPAPKETTP